MRNEEHLACLAFSESHRRRIRTANGLERFNEEIQRRGRVVRIFPNRQACLMLVTALAVETSEEWLTGRRYLDTEELKQECFCGSEREQGWSSRSDEQACMLGKPRKIWDLTSLLVGLRRRSSAWCGGGNAPASPGQRSVSPGQKTTSVNARPRPRRAATRSLPAGPDDFRRRTCFLPGEDGRRVGEK